jgi:hypothetical protein
VLTISCTCDSCGRRETADKGGAPDGWGRLEVAGIIRDLCRACVARLTGWTPDTG